MDSEDKGLLDKANKANPNKQSSTHKSSFDHDFVEQPSVTHSIVIDTAYYYKHAIL